MQAKEHISDTDKTKPASKFNHQHSRSSETFSDDDNLSSINRRLPKRFHRMRPRSVPRIYFSDTGSWREYDFSNYCTPDLRHPFQAAAIYIEQDLICKQREEIQLLMEELSNRDQELNDLVLSHQKQINAWEMENNKTAPLQARLCQCEEELKLKEEQLKITQEAMLKVKEQSEVDALALNRTQNEMVKLAERIMENSQYIQEMENENNNLSTSLRDILNAKQASSTREQELLSCIKEKDLLLEENEKEMEKYAEHSKYLENQCLELEEKINNMEEKSINWKGRYSQMKEEIELLADECKKKEESLQKMTQQLHEALQQAIALQKALFISCEREKCKEEVMFSLRKQHKRTMQELHNIRELYDRLSRGTVHHLNIQEKESEGDNKKVENLVTTEGGKGKTEKRLEVESDKMFSKIGRTINPNMGLLKSKHADGSSLAQEKKERKLQTRESNNLLMGKEINKDNLFENEMVRKGDKRGNVTETLTFPDFQRSSDEIHDYQQLGVPTGFNNFKPNLESPNATQAGYARSLITANNFNIYGNEPQYSRLGSNRIGYSSDPRESTQSVHFRNTSRNAEVTNSEINCNPNLPDTADKSDQPYSGSIVGYNQAQNSCSDSLINKDQATMMNLLQEPKSERYESQSKEVPSSVSMSRDKVPYMIDKERTDTQFSTNTDTNPVAHQQYLRNQSQRVDLSYNYEDFSESNASDKHSQHANQNYEMYSSASLERNGLSTVNSSTTQNLRSHPRNNPEHQNKCLSVDSEERQTSASKKCDTPPDKSHNSEQICGYDYEKQQQLKVGSNHDQQGIEADYKSVKFQEDSINRNVSDDNSLPLWHEPCEQCRNQGRQCCTCPTTQTSDGQLSETENFVADFSKKSVTSYNPENRSASKVSKISLVHSSHNLEYRPPIEGYERNHFQGGEKDSAAGNISRSDESIMNESSSVFHHTNRTNVHIPAFNRKENQRNSLPFSKLSSQCLPDDVSVYLAQQHTVKGDKYYNNNNKSNCHLEISELKSNELDVNKPDVENEHFGGNSRSRKLKLCNKQDLYHKIVQTLSLSEEIPKCFHDTERLAELREKYGLILNDRRNTMPCGSDNNNNRKEAIGRNNCRNVSGNSVKNGDKPCVKMKGKHRYKRSLGFKSGSDGNEVKIKTSNISSSNCSRYARLDMKRKENSRLDGELFGKSCCDLTSSINKLEHSTNEEISNVIAKTRAKIKQECKLENRVKDINTDDSKVDVKRKDIARLSFKNNFHRSAQRFSYLEKTVIFSSLDRLQLKKQQQMLSCQTARKNENLAEGFTEKYNYLEECD